MCLSDLPASPNGMNMKSDVCLFGLPTVWLKLITV